MGTNLLFPVSSLVDITRDLAILSLDGLIDAVFGLYLPVPPVLCIGVFCIAIYLVRSVISCLRG